MSNNIYFDLRKFETLNKDGSVNYTSFGFVIWDSYSSDYANYFESFEEVKKFMEDCGSVKGVLQKLFSDWERVWEENYKHFSGSVLEFFGETYNWNDEEENDDDEEEDDDE